MEHHLVLRHHNIGEALRRGCGLVAQLQAGISSGIEVGQSQLLRPGLAGDVRGILGGQVGPLLTLFPREEGAFGDEQICVLRQQDGVLAGPRVRDVGDDLTVQLQAAAQAGRGVAQKAAVQGEGQFVGAGRELPDLHGIGLAVQGDGEGLVDNCVQNLRCALLAQDC